MFSQSPLAGPGAASLTSHSLEIIIMLLVAFALGFLLAKMLAGKVKDHMAALERILKRSNTDNANLKAMLRATGSENDVLKKKFSVAEQDGKTMQAHIADLSGRLQAFPTALSVASVPVRDDLKLIEGIGPKIESILNADNIVTFADLAASSESQLRDLLMKQGERYRIHNPATWPQQAGLARDHEWDQLKTLQDELQGGREV